MSASTATGRGRSERMRVWLRDGPRGTAAGIAACAMALASVGALVAGVSHAADPSAAVATRCRDVNVVVNSPDRLDALTACDGARDAIMFLAAQGLDTAAAIELDIVQKLPERAGVSASAAGCYVESAGRIFVLSYSEFMKCGTWFRLPIDRDLYRSLVTHEVAHVLAAGNFAVAKPSIQAKEYIAYVTTFATMAPEQRERVLMQFPGKGFEGGWQMKASIYLFDPMQFGVQAYRHFLRPENGRGYLQAVLSGKALIE